MSVGGRRRVLGNKNWDLCRPLVHPCCEGDSPFRDHLHSLSSSDSREAPVTAWISLLKRVILS